MNSRRSFLLGLFLLLITTVLTAGGIADGGARGGADREKAVVVQVTGTVRLVGSGHFPELVITNSENEWYIAKKEMDKLYDLQHQTVTVKGNETVTEMRFANGLPAGTRRELQHITIIAIQ